MSIAGRMSAATSFAASVPGASVAPPSDAALPAVPAAVVPAPPDVPATPTPAAPAAWPTLPAAPGLSVRPPAAHPPKADAEANAEKLSQMRVRSALVIVPPKVAHTYGTVSTVKNPFARRD